MSWLGRLFGLLSPRLRRLFAWFTVVALIGTVTELAGIGLVLVLIRSLGGEGRSRLLDAIDNTVSIVDPARVYAREIDVVLFLFAAYGIRLGMALYQSWLRHHLVMGVQNELISRIFANLLSRPYECKAERDTAKALEVLNHTGVRVARNLTAGLLVFVTEAILVGAMLVFMVLQQPLTTLASAAGLALVYVIAHGITRRQLERNGRLGRDTYRSYDRTILDTLRGYRELVVYGRVGPAIDRHRSLLEQRAAIQRSTRVLLEVPRLIIETGVVYLALAIILSFLLRAVPTAEFTQQLVLVAIVVVRVLPASNRLALASSQVMENRVAAEDVTRRLTAPAPPLAAQPAAEAAKTPHLMRRLAMKNLSYRWPGADQPVIEDLTLTIARGEALGIIGPTGSGKTTLVELLIGLLPPESGQVLVDDAVLTPAVARNWLTRVGYAAQDVYLSDDTIAANIAFGRADPVTARAAVEAAGRLARLDRVIAGLPQGWDTRVGELGSRLSGGERQRIGIARALFSEPDLLILDEATSALDIHTEGEIAEAVAGLKGRITLVVVAHRLSTLAPCNRVLWLEQGRSRALGSYDEVVAAFTAAGQPGSAAA